MPQIHPRNHQEALPLHLTLAMLPWLASLTALPLSKRGWKTLSAPAPVAQCPAFAPLRSAWEKLLADPLLASAVEKEARKKVIEFLDGLRQYQQSDFARDVTEPPAVWRKGGARLLRYAGAAGGASILLIPSLINRYYILDLTRRLSFARYLSARGFNVFVVDWGEPSGAQRHFNASLYVTEILAPMAEWVRAQGARPLIVAGYCMGGLLALGLVQIRPDLADASAFLATPWDFFVPEFPRFALRPEGAAALESYIAGCDMLPSETIHALFHLANPYAFHAKLRQFARMDKKHPSTHEFLAIEHWVNDGVAMTRGVAHDCLVAWMQRNAAARGDWRVGGQAVDPSTLRMPCFIAAPRDDRIVPSASALPLAKLLKRRTLIEPKSGHVGMMVGGYRKAGLWEPFARWIDSQFT